MSRARATRLVLVNWLGVFYEKYELAEHVTALEGDNGAGKTTVMVAAYAAMLPDMTRLRFSNVGEGEPTGGDRGVHGRLGKPGRPSYAFVEIDVPRSEPLIAGVRLEPKSDPSVDLTPLFIEGIGRDVELSDVLLVRLGETDRIPELEELRDSIARNGGRLTVFKTAKDYFAALFDRGVTPLRLVSDEERSRFNDLLRTSMTGGLSRALTTGFRTFLLKEEAGLADMLVQMRANLDACRRTRTEVRQSRALEGEIRGVYEAGDEMFTLAMLATKERALETRKRLQDATEARDAAARACEQQRAEVEAAKQRHADAEAALGEAQGKLESARTRLQQVTEAHTIARRIAATLAELERLQPLQREAEQARDEARAGRENRQREQRTADDAQRRAAEGLAELQRGLEELHRRADAYRAVSRRLEEARTLAGKPGLDPAIAAAEVGSVSAEIEQLDAERSELSLRVADAARHRDEHGRATTALSQLCRTMPPLDRAHEAAREALTRLRKLASEAERIPALAQQLEDADEAVAGQQQARTRASAAAGDGPPLESASDVREALRGAEEGLEALTAKDHEEQRRRDALQAQKVDLQKRLAELDARAIRWREVDEVVRRVGEALQVELGSPAEVSAARRRVDDDVLACKQALGSASQQRTALRAEAAALQHGGGGGRGDLLEAADAVGGELVTTVFDDVSLERAARLQARLGPLADAIVVENPGDAARILATADREIETIWLVEGHVVQRLADNPGDSGDRDVVIAEQADAVRLTRLPERPTIGRRARARRVEELRTRADALTDDIAELELDSARLDGMRQDVELLLREIETLQRGDPARARASAAVELEGVTAEISAVEQALKELAMRRSAKTARVGRLRELLPIAHWLDQVDQAVLRDEIRRTLESARDARREVEDTRAAVETVERLLDALRRVPVSDDELAELGRRTEILAARRQTLYLAREALQYVADHQQALRWNDAEAALARKRDLQPALRRQYDAARDAADDARTRLTEAEEAFEAAVTAFNERHAEVQAQIKSRDLDRERLAATGVDDPSDDAMARAQRRVDDLGQAIERFAEADRKLLGEVSAGEERLKHREEEHGEAEAQREARDREWRPSQQSWDRLREAAQSDGLMTGAVAERLLQTGQGSPNLSSEARSRAALLQERLAAADGGEAVLERVKSWLGEEEDRAGALRQAWVVVRDWLRQRIPAQISQVDDPLEGLQRLQRQLADLEVLLQSQEADLRGRSQDVARTIDVHIRRARTQVRRLNQELERVRFGTIAGIEITLGRNERLGAVLDALRTGSAQELLFGAAVPLEEALEQLLRRHGGGRSRGEKLLDYREYLDVVVRVRRGGNTEWEQVNPAKLSTGEAIGVGAALMMVVLTAWERAANLLRAKRGAGTLRLLFLDEANRLSKDNLAVLFDLCQSLDLQLLIAAPEVAHARGCTTYRLARRVLPGGEHEVLVSGRRMIEVS